jgi:hypothetical protein
MLADAGHQLAASRLATTTGVSRPIPRQPRLQRRNQRRRFIVIAAGQPGRLPPIPVATGQPANSTTSPAKSPVTGDGHTGIGASPQIPPGHPALRTELVADCPICVTLSDLCP